MGNGNDDGTLTPRERLDSHEKQLAAHNRFMWRVSGGITVLAAGISILSALAIRFWPESIQGQPGRDGISVALGSIIAWPLPLPPAESSWWERWQVCDGRKLPEGRVDAGLAAELRRIYDQSGASAGEVALPDLRGYFLRGVDLPAREDRRDVGPRSKDSFEAGTTQKPMLKEHSHELELGGASHPNGHLAAGVNSSDDAWSTATKGILTIDRQQESVASRTEKGQGSSKATVHFKNQPALAESAIGAETRPYNVAVYWLMRVR